VHVSSGHTRGRKKRNRGRWTEDFLQEWEQTKWNFFLPFTSETFILQNSIWKHESLKSMKPRVYRPKWKKNNILKCDKSCFIEMFWLKTWRDIGNRRGNNIKTNLSRRRVRAWTEFSWLRISSAIRCRQHGDKHIGCTKMRVTLTS